ncbi:MAG: phosphoglycerate kinase [Candidatus Aminicenantales bacterium]
MRSISDGPVTGKKVFLRVDFNVPLDDKRAIRDDTRIRAALPTLRFLLEQGALVTAASHLGRPKGQRKPELSLMPVAERLKELIPADVILAPEVVGNQVEALKSHQTPETVILLENLRFHPGEKSNDPDFARELARGVDVYVNDAFGACHRAHASIVGIAPLVETAAAGFLLAREVEYLKKAVASPEKPYAAILGGAKISDKMPVLESLLDKADDILIGGAMAYTFFKAQGEDVGGSLVEPEQLNTAAQLLDRAASAGVRIWFPEDHIVAPEPRPNVQPKTVEGLPIPPGEMGLDIGPKTIETFTSIIKEAKTIFWNGPMGVFEIETFAEGTIALARAVAETEALSIVGGGDSAAAVDLAGVKDRISHISTGGGASLEYVAKGTLPGIEALEA